MNKLNFCTGAFDTVNTFAFEYEGRRGACRATGYLFKDKQENVIYLMKKAGMICDSYSEAQIAESDRLYNMSPVRHGDVVEVEGQRYKVRILGNFSDAGRLELF